MLSQTCLYTDKAKPLFGIIIVKTNQQHLLKDIYIYQQAQFLRFAASFLPINIYFFTVTP
jgi:hypothetical protein